MAYETEKDKRWRWRETNAVGAVAGLMFVALLLVGGLIAFLVIPSIVVTVPPPIPGQEEPNSDE
jgi:uncharacterized iron-regulated membrane protein